MVYEIFRFYMNVKIIKKGLENTGQFEWIFFSFIPHKHNSTEIYVSGNNIYFLLNVMGVTL